MERMLHGAGYTVQTAGTGEEGFELARANAYDVILSDMRMPGLTGLEALLTLRRANWQVPMILMTAFGSADVCREAERLGVEVVLEKPYAVRDLVAAVLSRLSAEAWARASRWADHGADAFRLGSDRTPG